MPAAAAGAGARCVLRLVVAARPASPDAEARALPADRGPCICIDSRGGRPRVSAGGGGGGACPGADGGPIRLSLRRPPHWRWQLTASRSCPAVRLTDERGALLAHTGPPPRQRPSPFVPPPPPPPPPPGLLAPPPAAPVHKSGSSLRRRPSIRRGAHSLPVSRVGSFRPRDDAPCQDRQANYRPMTTTAATTAASSGTSLAAPAPAVLVNGCLEAAAAAVAGRRRRRRRRRRRERVATAASASSSSSANASPRAPRRQQQQQQQQRTRRRKSAPDTGDRLVRVDGRPLRSFPEAARLLRGDGAPGGVVRLRLAPADHADPGAAPDPDPDADDPDADASDPEHQDSSPHLMGSNVSRHAGKRGQAGGAGAGAGGPGAGLAGRRALSSGSLCNGHNHKGGASARAAVPGSENGGEHGERAKLCGSLPNHLDGSDDGVGVGGAGELAGPDRNGGLELRLQPLRPAPGPPSPAPAPAPAPAPQPLYAPAPPLAAMATLAPTPALTPAPTPPLSLSPQPPPHAVSVCVTELYPFITPEATFAVALARGPRGLGLSLAGGAEDARDAWPGLVRVKRLFPQQPAWACGRLRQGDILLAANGVPLLGLTSYEALEVLRRAAGDVVLTVCRPPAELCCLAPPCEPPPPPPPPRRLPPAAAHAAPPPPAPHLLSPPSFEGAGAGEEVVVTLHKVNRSLGFTLRRGAHAGGAGGAGGAGDGGESDGGCPAEGPLPSGHFVRALVREPALSDGRVRPGDQILEVNGLDVGGLTHEEAVSFLRRCGDEVTLRLRRPAAAAPPPLAAPPSPWGAPPYDASSLSAATSAATTPPAPLSPSDDERPLRPKMLRREAMDMLSELAGRRLSPGDSSGSSTRGRPRRHASPAGPGASPGAGPAHAPAAGLGFGLGLGMFERWYRRSRCFHGW